MRNYLKDPIIKHIFEKPSTNLPQLGHITKLHWINFNTPKSLPLKKKEIQILCKHFPFIAIHIFPITKEITIKENS
jgi:hypothetical protein